MTESAYYTQETWHRTQELYRREEEQRRARGAFWNGLGWGIVVASIVFWLVVLLGGV